MLFESRCIMEFEAAVQALHSADAPCHVINQFTVDCSPHPEVHSCVKCRAPRYFRRGDRILLAL